MANKPFGKRLARTHGIAVEHALYRASGDWYHILKKFPAALFDDRGYILFKSPEHYLAFTARYGVKQSVSTNTLTIKGGISSHVDYKIFGGLFPDELPDATTVTEGAKRQVTVNVYERDPRARIACIEVWGNVCITCKFDFSKSYGALGEGFIHVHHLTPISSIGESYTLIPERDLRPVCPNCHAMLHRRNPPLSIDELCAILEQNAKNI